MICQSEAFEGSDTSLSALDLQIMKLLHASAVQAHQMVVVLALVEFINRFATLKVGAFQNTRLFELCKHTVDRRQTHINVFL